MKLWSSHKSPLFRVLLLFCSNGKQERTRKQPGAKRTQWEANNQVAPGQATQAVKDWANMNGLSGGANRPANKVGKSSGKPLECFKCGSNTHLVASYTQP